MGARVFLPPAAHLLGPRPSSSLVRWWRRKINWRFCNPLKKLVQPPHEKGGRRGKRVRKFINCTAEIDTFGSTGTLGRLWGFPELGFFYIAQLFNFGAIVRHHDSGPLGLCDFKPSVMADIERCAQNLAQKVCPTFITGLCKFVQREGGFAVLCKICFIYY